MTLPYTQSGKRNTLQKIFLGQFQSTNGTSSSARIASASFNCLPTPTCIFLFTFTAPFFGFFLHKNVPSIPVLVFKGLCLAPLAGTNTCGFVFSSTALPWVHFLLNSAVYTLAVPIWVLQFALLQAREQRPLPLEEVASLRMNEIH